MRHLIESATASLLERWRTVRDTSDGGYSTEAVLVTAALVILAIAVLAIIAAKVIAKAKAIDLG